MLSLRNLEIPQDFKQLFSKFRCHVTDNKELEELDAFEMFLGSNEYDFEMLKDDLQDIGNEYIQYRRESKQSKHVLHQIIQIITGNFKTILQPQHNHKKGNNHAKKPRNKSAVSHPKQSRYKHCRGPLLLNRQLNKVEWFLKKISCNTRQSPFETSDKTFKEVSQFIPHEWRYLRDLETISARNGLALSEYLVTGYHQSGLDINEYIAQNPLFDQLMKKFNLSPHDKHFNRAHHMMVNYLIEYERCMAKPLPSTQQQQLSITPYKDDISIIMTYMSSINDGLKRVLSDNSAYPVQLDVFFVAPDQHKELNLHGLRELGGLKADAESRRNGQVDGVADIYHLLRRISIDINKKHNQRYIMLIVRANKDNAEDDTIYIFSPQNGYDSIPDKIWSDHCELLYLINSRSDIVKGLESTAQGILGWTHHLHSHQCNKTYLSYGDYKSRVFSSDILSKLQLLFDVNNANKHKISHNARTEFMNSCRDLIDNQYYQIGEYFFNNNKSYECYKPHWNPQNCRAMGNVFISKQCTKDLAAYIDEEFENGQKLYYKLDYTVGMQIVDGQTIGIKGSRFGKIMALLNCELHHDKKPLYAILEKNTKDSKQLWKIADYGDDISRAFMTDDQLYERHGIYKLDLPKGSRAIHGNWENDIASIVVTKPLIRNTVWNQVRIIQSKQNIDKIKNSKLRKRFKTMKATPTAIADTLGVTEREFKSLALRAMNNLEREEKQLTPIAHFKFRRNEYHIELLLPVEIHGKWIAVSFFYNKGGDIGFETGSRTQVSGICLDLTDMRNKANLIGALPKDSWLNNITDEMTVNNLAINVEKSQYELFQQEQEEEEKKEKERELRELREKEKQKEKERIKAKNKKKNQKKTRKQRQKRREQRARKQTEYQQQSQYQQQAQYQQYRPAPRHQRQRQQQQQQQQQQNQQYQQHQQPKKVAVSPQPQPQQSQQYERVELPHFDHDQFPHFQHMSSLQSSHSMSSQLQSANASPMPFVQSKVVRTTNINTPNMSPPMQSQSQYQSRLQTQYPLTSVPQTQIYALTSVPQCALTSVPQCSLASVPQCTLTSVPQCSLASVPQCASQMLHSSSIGSVTSQTAAIPTTNCNATPSALSSVPNMPSMMTSQSSVPAQTMNVQATTQCPSGLTSVPNMQSYVQSAHYFANFLPTTHLPLNNHSSSSSSSSATSSVPVSNHCYYGTTQIAQSYHQPNTQSNHSHHHNHNLYMQR